MHDAISSSNSSCNIFFIIVTVIFIIIIAIKIIIIIFAISIIIYTTTIITNIILLSLAVTSTYIFPSPQHFSLEKKDIHSSSYGSGTP